MISVGAGIRTPTIAAGACAERQAQGLGRSEKITDAIKKWNATVRAALRSGAAAAPALRRMAAGKRPTVRRAITRGSLRASIAPGGRSSHRPAAQSCPCIRPKPAGQAVPWPNQSGRWNRSCRPRPSVEPTSYLELHALNSKGAPASVNPLGRAISGWETGRGNHAASRWSADRNSN